MKTIQAINSYHSNTTWSGHYSYRYFVARKEISLESAITLFIENLKNYCAQNTHYCYSRDLSKLLETAGNDYLHCLDANTLNNYIRQICVSGSKVINRSETTINRIKSVYRSFFKWCYVQKYIRFDISQEIRLKKTLSCCTLPITSEETTRLLNTISKSNDNLAQRDLALFAVYAFSGLRRFEAIALRVCDFDKDSKILFLPKSKRSSKKFQHIPAILSEILDDYLKDKHSSENVDKHSPMFCGHKSDSYLTARQASNRFEKWKGISGIRSNVTIHSFRAGFASLLYRNSKDPLLVSFALGHGSPASTTHYINQELFNIKPVLEQMFNGKELTKLRSSNRGDFRKERIEKKS